jgi:hypothetical protein
MNHARVRGSVLRNRQKLILEALQSLARLFVGRLLNRGGGILSALQGVLGELEIVLYRLNEQVIIGFCHNGAALTNSPKNGYASFKFTATGPRLPGKTSKVTRSSWAKVVIPDDCTAAAALD